MNKTLTQSVSQQINVWYEAIVAILLAPESYSHRAKTENVQTYLDFVEAALEKPYSRIVHLCAFVESTDSLMSDRMYPFCYLLDAAKEKVINCRYQSEWLLDGLEAKALGASETIGIEPHELLESC